jgi:glycosyltransferase involved in cell wall biosynthesis
MGNDTQDVGERWPSVKILLFSPVAPPPGGIATWTEGLLRFAIRDPGVIIVHIDSSVHYASQAKMRTHSPLGFATRVIGGSCHGIVLFAKCAAALIFNNIDIVHICSSCSLGMFRDSAIMAFSRLLRVPIVLHLHSDGLCEKVTARNWETALIRTACRLAKYVIVLDLHSAEALCSLVPDCSVFQVMNPAWKFSEAPARPVNTGGTKVIVFAGHVVPLKGVRELVLACRDIVDAEFRVDIFGPVEDDFRKDLLALGRVREDGKWLTVSGPVGNEEAINRISSGFAVVLASDKEGCPYIVLEAMMLGKPVIATPVGAIPQMLSFDGGKHCGLSVPVRDVGALRLAIQSLLRQPDYAEKLGRNGRERVAQEFSPRRAYELYKSIWKKSAARL